MVVLSFLIPVSTMLRAVVLERETKLREQLLIMGTSLSAYYASHAVVHLSTFLLIAIVSALVTIGGGALRPHNGHLGPCCRIVTSVLSAQVRSCSRLLQS